MMPCVQQLRKSALCLILLALVLIQTCIQLHITHNYDNDDASQSSSQAYRLKRSASSPQDDIFDESNDISPGSSSTSPPISQALFTPSESLILQSLLLSSSPQMSSTPEPQHSWTHDIPPHLLLHNFYSGNFSHPNPSLCSTKPNASLFILVTSGIDHFDKRQSVRQTWGHYALRSDVQLAFVIGDSLLHKYTSQVQHDLQKEMDIFNDFIIGSFPDTYRNLTLKTLHMLQWISTYCAHVPYFLKTDDDVFLNVPGLLSLVHRVKEDDAESPTIYGHIFSGNPPSRNPSHRHFVPYDVYPHNLTFPNFTSGPAYLMPTKLAAPLLQEGLKLPFIPLEDVLITGFAATNLGIPRVDLPEFLNEEKNPSVLPACQLIKILAGMTDGSGTQMSYVWFNYMMGRNLCLWTPHRLFTSNYSHK